MRHLRNLPALLLLTLMPSALWAERAVDESITASSNAVVQIENIAGSVRVTGWDQDRVQVTGTLGDDVEGLALSKSGSEVYIEVEIDDRSGRRMMDADAQLDIQIPYGASVEISTVSANIDVQGISGTAELETVSGAIQVGGGIPAVEAESVSGQIDIAGEGTRAEIESVSGAVTVTGAGESVEVATVSGVITVSGDGFREVDFESVSGAIEFSGSLEMGAEVNVEAHSSTVTLHLPSDLSAYIEVQTFSGTIDNAFGAEAERVDQYTPEKRLEFRAGSGDAEIAVETFSGNVLLRKM